MSYLSDSRCPRCGGEVTDTFHMFVEDGDMMAEFDNSAKCPHCGTQLQITVSYDVNLLAWDAASETFYDYGDYPIKRPKVYACDGPEGLCPYRAESGSTCRDLCGLGVDEDETI